MIRRYYQNLWRQTPALGRATFPWDLLRGLSHGAVSAVPATFALYVAIEYFEATVFQKSAIAGAAFLGLLFSLPYAAWSPVIKRRALRCFFPLLGAAAGLLGASVARSAMSYTLCIVVFGVCFNLSVPVLTAIYRDNYAGSIRGRIFGITTVFSVLAGLCVQFAGGRALDTTLEAYRGVFAGISVMVVVGAFAILRMPSNQREGEVPENPFSYFALLREHRTFSYVLAAWFLFGAANLGLMPQRIEYLTQPEYGLELNPALLFLVVGVTVEGTRLLAIQVWAYLFDHFNFIKLRVFMTGFLLAHLLVFFHAKSIPVLLLGAALQGCAFGGGVIAWTLWVTKFAPKELTIQFMAIHTFSTGLRGAVVPLLGYWLVASVGIHATVWMAAGLTAFSMAMMWRIAALPTRVVPVAAD